MSKLFYLVAPFLLLSACVTAEVTKLNNAQYPLIAPQDVVVYLSEDDIQGEFEKVALIVTKGSSSAGGEGKHYDKARKEAAKLGANGILVGTLSSPSTAQQVWGSLLGTGTSRSSEILAIYVRP